MMYSAYKLNKQGDNIRPWRTPFPIWNQSVPCPVLTVADDTTLMAESEEELKSLLIKVKEESEKADLKLSIQKAKIMASGLITS